MIAQGKQKSHSIFCTPIWGPRPVRRLQTGLEDARQAGRCVAEQLAAQTATVAALEDQMSGLRRCMAAREAEFDKVYEQLRVAQRELDQSRRESAAQVKVRSIVFALYRY